MPKKSKPLRSKWKLVKDFPIREYRCGARAGEKVRLRCEIPIYDHRSKPTGKFHTLGEIWTVVRGAAEEPRVLWLHGPDGSTHTCDDDEKFWTWFERVNDRSGSDKLREL